MKFNFHIPLVTPLAKRLRKLSGQASCAEYTFFGSCADVPTKTKQTLSDPGHSVSDRAGHYDIDGVSYNPNEGVVVAADPRPVVLSLNHEAKAGT